MGKDEYRSGVRDGMRIDWDVPVPMPDGTVLRADVYRPSAEGRYPVIMTHGPYAKGLALPVIPRARGGSPSIRRGPYPR